MMRRTVIDERSDKIIRTDYAEPECGDFCDTCGDCLRCFGWSDCPGYAGMDGPHRWIKYEGKEGE